VVTSAGTVPARSAQAKNRRAAARSRRSDSRNIDDLAVLGELLAESRVTSDPSLRAVFIEDAVSVFGDVIAFAARALNQITGSSVYQGRRKRSTGSTSWPSAGAQAVNTQVLHEEVRLRCMAPGGRNPGAC